MWHVKLAIFCHFDILREIFCIRHFARRHFTIRYFAIRYFAFRYFVRNPLPTHVDKIAAYAAFAEQTNNDLDRKKSLIRKHWGEEVNLGSGFSDENKLTCL